MRQLTENETQTISGGLIEFFDISATTLAAAVCVLYLAEKLYQRYENHQ